VNGISLLKHLLVRRVLVDEAGNERVVRGLADAVEQEAGGESRDGDVETWLFAAKQLSG
jgi:hypothetical protein